MFAKWNCAITINIDSFKGKRTQKERRLLTAHKLLIDSRILSSKIKQLTELPIQQCQFILSSMSFHYSFQFDSILQSHFPLPTSAFQSSTKFITSRISSLESQKATRLSYKYCGGRSRIVLSSLENCFSSAYSPILTLFLPLFGGN